MGSQSPSRRQLLQAIACASLASSFTGFSRWAYGFEDTNEVHQRHDITSVEEATTKYKPRFFSVAEYEMVVVLAELILPRTSSTTAPTGRYNFLSWRQKNSLNASDAGATDAGVAEFIDFMISQDVLLQPIFRDGLACLTRASGPAQHFISLTPSDQEILLGRLAYKDKFRTSEETEQKFFALMRRYTVMGFYTSRIGIQSLDYPGLSFYGALPVAPWDEFQHSRNKEIRE